MVIGGAVGRDGVAGIGVGAEGRADVGGAIVYHPGICIDIKRAEGGGDVHHRADQFLLLRQKILVRRIVILGRRIHVLHENPCHAASTGNRRVGAGGIAVIPARESGLAGRIRRKIIAGNNQNLATHLPYRQVLAECCLPRLIMRVRGQESTHRSLVIRFVNLRKNLSVRLIAHEHNHELPRVGGQEGIED